MKYKWIELPEGYLNISKVIWFDAHDYGSFVDIRACIGIDVDIHDEHCTKSVTVKRYYHDRKYMLLPEKKTFTPGDATKVAMADLKKMIEAISSTDTNSVIYGQLNFAFDSRN